MEDKHRDILRDHGPNIIRDLEPNNILPHLGRVLTEKEVAEIKAQSTRQDRCVKLLEILPRKGPFAFTKLVYALDKEADHLALELIKAEKEHIEEKLNSTRVRSAKIQREISDLKAELDAEEQNIETLERVKSDIATRLSNTRDLTEIKLERDELKKQCESLAKHLEEAQLVVSNLTKKLTATFQDRATSTRDLEEFDRTEGTTEHDLCDAREHSEKLRGEIRQLKTELEAEKQDHIKTSQELKELKSHHETPKTEKSEQIKKLDDRIQQLTDSAERENQAWKKEIQEWKTKSEKYEQENQALRKSLESAMEKREKLEVLSSDLERANEKQQEQIGPPQRMNEELVQDKVTNERELKTPAENFQQHTELHYAAEPFCTCPEIQEWKTKSKRYEQEKRALQESLESAMEIQGKLELLSSDLETANEEQQEQIRQLQRMNEELEDKVTNEREQHKVERDSVFKEKRTLQKNNDELKKKNRNCQRGYQALKKRYEDLKKAKKPEAEKETQQNTVKQVQRKITRLGYKVSKQMSEFEEKLACKKRKEMTTEAKRKELESETKVKASLQARVFELENELKNCQKKMSEQEERFREETNTERLKSDRLQEEVSGLKSRLRETIGPGGIYSYLNDFDTRGVVYASARRTSSFGAGIIATRSCGNTGAGEPKDILEHQVKGGTVCATSYVKDSWWCVDLTDKYALYLTHYTLRHGQEKQKAFLRHWRLEGSLDGVEWTTLKEHENDTGLIGNKPYCTHTWAITGKFKAFRYFRIFQTGWHSSGSFGIVLSGIEMYGVLVEISS